MIFKESCEIFKKEKKLNDKNYEKK